MEITILGIESSCDDTSAAVLRDTTLLSSVIASQAVHEKYGGVIPELASRAHQQNIVPVVDTALKEAGKTPDKIDAIAFTRGPGLLGSLLVGTSFAKGLAIAHNIPMVEVNHLHGHILSHFVDMPDRTLPHPDFPFLCLLVSGGHTQIVKVDTPSRARRATSAPRSWGCPTPEVQPSTVWRRRATRRRSASPSRMWTGSTTRSRG